MVYLMKQHTLIMERHVWAEITNLMEQRNHTKLLSMKHKKQNEYEEYKRIKNKVSSALRKCKADYLLQGMNSWECNQTG